MPIVSPLNKTAGLEFTMEGLLCIGGRCTCTQGVGFTVGFINDHGGLQLSTHQGGRVQMQLV